jgi:hypothetical protein
MFTEDHLVEQPAVRLIQHELGCEVMICYDEWNGGVSNQGRDGKREVGGNIELPTSNVEVKRREEEEADESGAATAESGSAGGGD